MAPHSSTLTWRIPGTEEPGGLWSMGSLRVGHDRATSLSLFTYMHWRKKWQPTPVFLPGESQGRGSLVGCCLWGRTESDTTEATYQHAVWLDLVVHKFLWGLPWWLSGKKSVCQCRRCGFNPWVGKILWRRMWQPSLGFLAGKFHG